MLTSTTITYLTFKWLPIIFLCSFPTTIKSSDSNPTVRSTLPDSIATILNIYDEVLSTEEARKLYTLDTLFGNFREKMINSDRKYEHAEEISVDVSPVKEPEYAKKVSEARLHNEDYDLQIKPKIPFVFSIAGMVQETALPDERIVEEATVNARELKHQKSSGEKLQVSALKFSNLHDEREERINVSNPIDLISILSSNEDLNVGEMHRSDKIKSQTHMTASFQNDSPEVDEIQVPVEETTWRKPGPATKICFPDLNIPKEVVEVMRGSAQRCVRHANQKLEVFRETLPCSELRQLLLDSLVDDSTEKADLRDAGKLRPPRHSTHQNPLPEVEVFNSSAYRANAYAQRPVLQLDEDAEIVHVPASELYHNESKLEWPILIARPTPDRVSNLFNSSLVHDAREGSYDWPGITEKVQYEQDGTTEDWAAQSVDNRTKFVDNKNQEKSTQLKNATFQDITNFTESDVFLGSHDGTLEKEQKLLPFSENQKKDIIDLTDGKSWGLRLPQSKDAMDIKNWNEKLSAHGTTGSLPLLLPPSLPSSVTLKSSMRVLFEYLLEEKFRQLLTTCLMSSLNLLTLDSGLEVVSFKALVSKVFSPSSPDVALLHAIVDRCSGGASVLPYKQVQAVMECVQAKIDVLCMTRLQLSPDEVYDTKLYTTPSPDDEFYSEVEVTPSGL
ncbi:hypothetical protein FHG87_006826 [Trinorchestia longiramus]|nr:hypothetical protein FHG87_006826 [Trinorchestia longiramus]